LETIEKLNLLEYFAVNFRSFGTVLEIITDRSQEGAQFCRGFGGIGGILRYKVEFQQEDDIDLENFDMDAFEDDADAFV